MLRSGLICGLPSYRVLLENGVCLIWTAPRFLHVLKR